VPAGSVRSDPASDGRGATCSPSSPSAPRPGLPRRARPGAYRGAALNPLFAKTCRLRSGGHRPAM